MRVAYIHGRPAPHPMHQKFAESVQGEFHYVDFIMRWQDRNKIVAYRLLSWIVCGFRFPNRSHYDVFLVDNLHFMPVLMKVFGMITKRQKIVAHLGSHTLYFIYSHRFSKISEYFHKWALKRYDALICEGEMATQLIESILTKDEMPLIYMVHNGIPDVHSPNHRVVNLGTKNILFIGNGPGKERLWYKGLDLMVSAFEKALKNDPNLIFTIVGTWERHLIAALLNTLNMNTRSAIKFIEATPNLSEIISENSLYLHCARGEAYGITILIAMANGVPAIVSDWTGAKEVVSKVDSNLIVPIDSEIIAKKIEWYFKLSHQDKKSLSDKGIEVTKVYTEKGAIEHYQKMFSEMLTDLGLRESSVLD